MNVLKRLYDNFDAWMTRRHYEKQHLEFIRTTIRNDLRWLSVHPAGMELLERYEKLVSPNWYEHHFEDIGVLRRRLGWCPHENKMRF